jgi:hypothetical protein
MKNFKQYAVIGAMLIIAVSIYVYGGIYKANKQRNYEASLIEMKQSQYSDCVSFADSSYLDSWNEQCERLGKEKDCFLTEISYELIEKRHNIEIDRCVKLYK